MKCQKGMTNGIWIALMKHGLATMQVQVKKVFSSLKFITSPERSNVKEEILEEFSLIV